jgi:hypothetical protein
LFVEQQKKQVTTAYFLNNHQTLSTIEFPVAFDLTAKSLGIL